VSSTAQGLLATGEAVEVRGRLGEEVADLASRGNISRKHSSAKAEARVLPQRGQLKN